MHSAVGCRLRPTPELFRLETSASSGLPAPHNRLRKCYGFRERALNTVQTDTLRRCSNTPSLAALPVATTLRSHHRAHSRSRHRTTPGRGTTATLTGVNRLSHIVYRNMAEAAINYKRCTINARYSGTSICRYPLPTSRRTPGPTIALRLAAYAPRQRRERWARLSWRHPTGTNSLRSLEPSPCGRGCLATASLIHSAPPLRYRLHTSGRHTAPTICTLTSATIQGLFDIRIRRHSLRAFPHDSA